MIILKKIRTKLITGMTICSITSMLLLGLGMLTKGVQISKEIATVVLSMNIENKSQEFNSILKDTEEMVHFLAQSILSEFDISKIKDSQYLDDYKSHIGPLIKDLGENSEDIISSYFYFNPEITNGFHYSSFIMDNSSSDFIVDDTYTLEDFTPYKEGMEWYYDPINQNRGVWSDVYIDIHSNVQMISYTFPVKMDNVVIGVVGMDIDFSHFKSIVNAMNFYETGYGSLLNSNYDFLVHPQFSITENLKTIENGSLKFITDEIKVSDSSIIEYTFKDQKKILGYSKLSNGFILTADVPYKEITAEISKLFNFMVILLIINSIMTAIIAIFISSTITKPISKITNLIEKTSKFDLGYNQSFSNLIKYKDEIGIMAKSVIEMREELRRIIEKISENSENLFISSKGIADSAIENASAIDEVSHTTEMLAQGAGSQAKQAQEGSIKLSNLGREINNVSQKGNQIQLLMEKTNDAKNNGMNAINTLKERVKDYNKLKAFIAESIIDLNEKSFSISEITNTIKNITKQINLLSLNATIEAARAGESGKGFGIIANEIRNLSEQTTKSSSEIDYTVRQVQFSIQNVQKKIQELNVVLEQSNHASNQTIDAFGNIDVSIKEILNEIQILLRDVSIMNQNKNQAILSIEEIAAITEESAASTQEVLASVETQSSSIEEIAQGADSLKNLAHNLKNLIGAFKL